MFQISEMDCAELASKLESGDAEDFQLIDVRSPAEVAQGSVPGAANLPLHLLPLQMGTLDRDKSMVFICRSGARSAQACAFLMQHGFESVLNLCGGMMTWAGSGLPMGKATALAN